MKNSFTLICCRPSNTATNNVEFITIASGGNGTNFGDLTYARLETYGAVASSTRGVFGAGNDGSDGFAEIQFKVGTAF